MSQPIDRKTFLGIFFTVFLPMFLAAVDQTLLATATPAIVRELGNLATWQLATFFLDCDWLHAGKCSQCSGLRLVRGSVWT